MLRQFRQYFWLPPRAHGEVDEGRSVSFLELFYDLVYVVVIARAAHTLAGNVSWRGVADFAVIFGAIWFAWLSGSLFYDLHGREDGRTRIFVFIQMMLLALLAVFTAEAQAEDGPAFALTYAAFLGVLTYLWYSVRRQDSQEYMALSGRFVIANGLSVVAMAASATFSDDARLITWAVFVAGWVLLSLVLGRHQRDVTGWAATDSLVERFGLFTIIVLGEVVVGVVDGLSEAPKDAKTIATGLVGLMIGFSFWWTYFDIVGRRLPRGEWPGPDSAPMSRWIYSHLPVTMAIAAGGAAMVALIEHAGDARTPEPTAWLLGGSVAVALVSLVVVMNTLRDALRLPELYQPLSGAMLVAAGLAVVVGALAPAPLVLAISLVAILSLVWWFAVDRLLRLPDPDMARPNYQPEE